MKAIARGPLRNRGKERRPSVRSGAYVEKKRERAEENSAIRAIDQERGSFFSIATRRSRALFRPRDRFPSRPLAARAAPERESVFVGGDACVTSGLREASSGFGFARSSVDQRHE